VSVLNFVVFSKICVDTDPFNIVSVKDFTMLVIVIVIIIIIIIIIGYFTRLSLIQCLFFFTSRVMLLACICKSKDFV